MKQMKNRVLAVGGGSAGHVAPVVAVIDELAARNPEIIVRFWCDRGYLSQTRVLMKNASIEVKVEKIVAGKLRRYYGTSLVRRLFDVVTIVSNAIDMVLVVIGFVQALVKLIVWRPDVVFCKGGFVCLPVGYAASLLRIPIVLHDSDTRAGLTNRLLASRARLIATGAPLSNYNYPANKSSFVGIPVKNEFRRYSDHEKDHIRQLFNIETGRPLLVVIGGSLGAKRINDTMIQIAPSLVENMSVIHICGHKQYRELKSKIPDTQRYQLIDFISQGLAPLLAAADVVISRAGATTVAELAAVRACVIVAPSMYLSDQQKNAKALADARAAVFADESVFIKKPDVLDELINELITQPQRRHQLSKQLATFSKLDAAKQTARLIETVQWSSQK